MTPLIFRPLEPSELEKLREIDRSERVSVGYRVSNGVLEPRAVDWDIPTLLSGEDGPNTVAAHIQFCQRHLNAGARAIGAFHDETLVGIALMTPEIRPGTAQLAYLHVSRGFRRRDVAKRLLEELVGFALRSGAAQIYVSATPSESAVGFYRAFGFRLVDPLPELYALEPEDIHMILDLPGVRS